MDVRRHIRIARVVFLRWSFGRKVAAAFGTVTFGTAIGVAANVMDVQEPICAVSPQPAVSDVCGALGMAGLPTREERLAFEKLLPNKDDCDALDAFLAEHDDSPFGVRVSLWRLREKPVELPDRKVIEARHRMSIRPAFRSFASTANARQFALEQAQTDADTFCMPRTGSELVSAGIADDDLTCTSDAGCSGDFTIVCQYSRAVIGKVCGQ